MRVCGDVRGALRMRCVAAWCFAEGKTPLVGSLVGRTLGAFSVWRDGGYMRVVILALMVKGAKKGEGAAEVRWKKGKLGGRRKVRGRKSNY